MASLGVSARSIVAPGLAASILLGTPVSARIAPIVVSSDPGQYGVFISLVEDAGTTFSEATTALELSLNQAGFEILSTHTPNCACEDYQGRVYALQKAEYTEALMAHGTLAAFALPLRVALIEDERGVHLVAVNPQSLNRTIVSETEADGLSLQAVELLETVALSAFPGRVRIRQYGQLRDRGLIGKTMGIIAGGPFEEKVEEIARVELESPADIGDLARRITEGLKDTGGGWKWGIQPIYTLDLSAYGAAVIGVTGDRMELDSYQIVGSGSDESRDKLACAGIDHAPAFPIELVLVADGDEARILLIDEMFRMKMFFEDAGKVKFAMNMKMPGSIEDEIRDKIAEAIY